MKINASKGIYKDNVEISFSIVENAVKYLIFRKPLNNGVITQIDETTEIVYKDLTVIPGTAYVYYVCSVIDEVVSDLIDPDIGYAGHLVEEVENNVIEKEFLNEDFDIIFNFNNTLFESDTIIIKAINFNGEEVLVENTHSRINKNFIKWNTINMPIKQRNSKVIIMATIDGTDKKSTVILDIKGNSSLQLSTEFGKLIF